MNKKEEQALQRSNDFERRMNPPLTADRKRLVAIFEKLLTTSTEPSPWNAGIMKCINATKGI